MQFILATLHLSYFLQFITNHKIRLPCLLRCDTNNLVGKSWSWVPPRVFHIVDSMTPSVGKARNNNRERDSSRSHNMRNCTCIVVSCDSRVDKALEWKTSSNERSAVQVPIRVEEGIHHWRAQTRAKLDSDGSSVFFSVPIMTFQIPMFLLSNQSRFNATLELNTHWESVRKNLNTQLNV